MADFSLGDLLAAYGGSPDPENPSSGQITPGLLLRALQAADVGGSQAFGKMATDIATLPRRAIEGSAAYSPGLRREDVTDIPGSAQPADVAVAPATEAAMNLVGFGSPFAQAGSAGIFGGRLARDAPLDKYAAADALLAKGAKREQIFKETGLTLGKDLQLRHEISDAAMKFTPAGEEAIANRTTGLRADQVIDHPELWRAYPDVGAYKVSFMDPIPGSKSFGGIDKASKTLYINPEMFDPEVLAQYNITPEQVRRGVVPGLEGMRSTSLHELQHMVQEAEGHATGGNVMLPEVRKAADSFLSKQKLGMQNELTHITGQRDAYIRAQQMAGRDGDPSTWAKEFYDANPLMLNRAAELKYRIYQTNSPANKAQALQDAYQRLAGEAESRNTQYRRDMTAEERAATPAWQTQDVPYGEQLLRFTDPYGNTITKGEAGARRFFKQGDIAPGKLSLDAPSFSERMAEGRDIAQRDRNRGAGNILPRSTANEAPLLAPGETRGDLVGRLTPGMQPAERSIADIGRDAYRARLEQPQTTTEFDLERLQPTGAVTRGLENVRDAPYALPTANANIPGMTRVRSPGTPPERIMDESSFRIPSRAEVLSGYTQSTANPLADLPRRGNVTGIRPNIELQSELKPEAAARPEPSLAAPYPQPAGAANVDRPPVAPSIISRANPTPADVRAIYNKLAETGRGDVWPPAQNPVFKTTPEAYAETQSLVPQRSIAAELPQMPDPSKALPLNDRARLLMTQADPIAANIAERLAPMVRSDSPLLDFYQTGPVIRGLAEHAVGDVPAANEFMRGWSGQGAATSPRTQTPPNLRNASHLLYQRAQGNPITPGVWEAQGNVKGLPMMRMHVDLADKFATGTANPLQNPKPFTFRENWAGNQLDPTIDTHNIRSTLLMLDQIRPGALPREWFTSDAAYYNYKEGGGFNAGKVPPGAINDALASAALNKVESQVEYPIVQEPWRRAAAQLGIVPARAQSGGWFEFGGQTGLRSPPQTIPDLLNNQIEATAKVLNVPPQKVLEWWGQGKIPLAGIAGSVGLADVLMGQQQREAQ